MAEYTSKMKAQDTLLGISAAMAGDALDMLKEATRGGSVAERVMVLIVAAVSIHAAVSIGFVVATLTLRPDETPTKP